MGCVSIAQHLHDEGGASRNSREAENPDNLSELLEKTSLELIPYGRPETPYWLAIWDFRLEVDDAVFGEWLNGAEDIPRSLREWMGEVAECESVVEAQLTIASTSSAQRRVYFCCQASFGSARSRDEFVHSEVPQYRERYPVLWLHETAPTLITVD